MKLFPDWLIEAFKDGGTPALTSMTRVIAFGTVASVVWLPVVAHVEVCLLKQIPIVTMDFAAFVTAACGATTALFIFNKRAE